MQLKIFISHASDCLTDHLPHGEGLLCFMWLKSLADRGHRIYAFSPNADIKIQHDNIIVFKSNKKILFPSLRYWIYAKESHKILRKVLKNDKIDIVWRMYPYSTTVPILYTFKKPLLIGPLYSYYNRINLNPEVKFGFKIHQIGNYFAKYGWKKNLSKAEAILCESSLTAKDLKSFFSEKLVFQLPAIVSPPLNINEREIPNFKFGIRLIFVGHFEPAKRLLDFCKIVYVLRQKGFKAYANVVGEGEDYDKAINYCKEVLVLKYVNFLGKVPNTEIYRILSESHFLISLLKESYGRAIVESMSVGTPVICVNKLGPADYLEQGVSGVLLDNITYESYIEAIEEIIKEPKRWKEISNNSLKRSKQWSEGIISENLEKFLCEVLAKKKM